MLALRRERSDTGVTAVEGGRRCVCVVPELSVNFGLVAVCIYHYPYVLAQSALRGGGRVEGGGSRFDKWKTYTWLKESRYCSTSVGTYSTFIFA